MKLFNPIPFVLGMAGVLCLARPSGDDARLLARDRNLAIRLQMHMANVAKKVAVPIPSLETDDNFRGFDQVAERLAKSRLVGLGESTHGTHEFNQFRTKLFRILVQRHGFTHFLLEDTAFATAPMEMYIQGQGQNDPKAALTKVMWPWCTDDMVDFMRWARRHNSGQKDEARKVHILGIDVQKPYQQALYLVDQMRASHQPQEVVEALMRIAESMPKADAMNPQELANQHADPATPVRWRRVRAELAMLELRFGKELQPELKALFRSLEFGVEHELASDDSTRDRGMAMQILDALDRMPAESKAIWWAHNSHVSGGSPERFPWAGTLLRGRLESQYSVLGCFTREGTLTSKDGRLERQYWNPDGTFKPGLPILAPGPMAFRFPDNFLEGILARTLDRGVVFMEDLKRDPASREYLNTRFIECSGVGTPFDPALTADDRTPFQSDAFDALFFIRQSTAATNARFPQRAEPAR